MSTYPVVKCPKCQRPLQAEGEITVSTLGTFPVYSCDHCLVKAQVMGTVMDMAYTFCLDPQGKPFDPAAPELDA